MNRRAAPLVSQYLEGISSRALEKYQSVIRQFVRRRHGVYALYKGKRLYYVGLASNLASRLRHHLQDRHRGAWDTFSVYLTVGGDHLRELEALSIRIASPKGNSLKGGFRKAENLTREFKREIRTFYQREVDQLFKGRIVPDDDTVGGEHPLSAYVKRPFPIRFKYKGKTYWARVRRDGRIRFKGKLYTSPSLPASSICGGRAANGWMCWQYERAPSDWVPLDTLRR